VQPETRYARLGPDRIAYQVVGEGPPDLVLNVGTFSHVDIVWDDPGLALFLRSLASFSRLIRYDRRGTGASDPLPPDPQPPMEAFADELVAVMDAAGCKRVAIMASTPESGPMAVFFAATRPERVSALVLVHATARYVADDDYPIGLPAERVEAMLAGVEEAWGTGRSIADGIPSHAGDARFQEWMGRMQRAMASPRVVRTYLRALFELDVRPLLPLVHAPTLVLHRTDFQLLPVEHARYLAKHLPDAKLLELPGVDGPPFWETPEIILDHVEEFLTGVRHVAAPERVLATVLFTDIVGSTEQAERSGDRHWRRLLDAHDEAARRLVERHGGRLVKTTGDGILATFDGPGRALGCASALMDELEGVGLRLRAGVHTGEVELRDGDVGGIAVHIAARVLAAAEPAEILASRTVRDLVVGSGIELSDRGSHQLKGVAEPWQLFALAR
jgi:class 3 adenylate cyclase/pimeloyl-ACP methyl ester carboxylesterase